jgi:PAS domain S-box-containing protein
MRLEDLGIGKLFESVRDAVIVAEAKTERIVLWNPAAEKVFGYSIPEALEMRVEALVPGDLKARHRKGIARYGETGHGRYIDAHTLLDLPAVKKDGEEIRIELSLNPIGALDERDGDRRFVLAIVRDATERKRAEEEVRRLNETLGKQVAERTARLIESERRLKDLVAKLVVSQEEERQRVAYEVHDGPTQMAVALHQRLQDFAYKHPPDSTVGKEKLDKILALAQRTVKETRGIIEGLRPTALDDYGLAAAIRLRIEELEEEGWRIDYEEALGDGRLGPEMETALYRIAQEALTNVGKHARTKRARVVLKQHSGKIRLEVEDGGYGFDPCAPKSGGGPGERVGLHGMKERVALLGGELEIASAPGVGTSLVVEVPLPPARRAEGDGRAG